MGKVKERKSESWKPTMVQDSSFISKNKKRKERRMSQVDPSSTINFKELTESISRKLSSSKMDSNEASEKAKSKGKVNQSFSMAAKNKKKDNKALSVSLPIGVGKSKKENQPLPKKNKFPGILCNSDTPKKMNGHVTFKNSPKLEKLIDDEAVEMEEPITEKEVKPFPTKKGKKLPKLETNSESDDDDDLSEEDGLLDMEASEGEETVEESSDYNDISTEEDSDAGEEVSGMSDYSAEDDGSDEEEESDQDEGNESDEDNETAKVSKIVPLKEKENKKGKKKTSELLESKKPAAATAKEVVASKPEQTSNQSSKKDKKQSSVEKSDPKSKKAAKKSGIEANKENVESVETKKVCPFVGFIGGLPEKINEKVIKNALSKSVNQADILLLSLKKCNRPKNTLRCLVYVKDENTLNALMNVEYKTNGVAFTVSRARESKKPEKGKFMAFLPRVPISISDESIKQAIIKELGSDSILNFKSGKVYERFQTRNLLVELASLDLLKKLILKEECIVSGQSVVVREAFEAGGLSVPFYRVVISELPENTTAPALTKVIEAKTGKNTVLNIRFSLRKKSFAFVSFKSEEAQKKALDVGNELTLDGKQLKVIKFVPRKPHKRGARKSTKNSESKQESKKRKMDSASSEDSPKKAKQQKIEKSKKQANKPTSNASPSGKVNEKKQKKKEKKAKNLKPANTKAAKNPQSVDKKEIKKKALSEKIETKKSKLKEKKIKKKAGKSD